MQVAAPKPATASNDLLGLGENGCLTNLKIEHFFLFFSYVNVSKKDIMFHVQEIYRQAHNLLELFLD